MADHVFSGRVLEWFDAHGRRDLPWQDNPTPYRVWVSEIMLQQTQVKTVVEYYLRFMTRFPDVMTLADAGIDDVLHHWSGLGYYARARNLHRSAQVIKDTYAGRFPLNRDALEGLPGIGRSTAGAILAISANQRHAILDGNVKRVLARHAGIQGWPGIGAVTATLWQLAESYTPDARVADYTQAIMDLGATLCVRRTPRCNECPVSTDCVAKRDHLTDSLPGAKPRKALPVRSTRWVIFRDDNGRVLLERRPPSGLWGGLWSPPECPEDIALDAWWSERFGIKATQTRALAPFRHTFSHFHLDIETVLVEIAPDTSNHVAEAPPYAWITPSAPEALGFAAPVLRLLSTLPERHS